MTGAAVFGICIILGVFMSALMKLYWAGHDHQAYYADVPSRFAFVNALPFRVTRADSALRKLGFAALGVTIIGAIFLSLAVVVTMARFIGTDTSALVLPVLAYGVGAAVGGNVASRLQREIWPGMER